MGNHSIEVVKYNVVGDGVRTVRIGAACFTSPGRVGVQLVLKFRCHALAACEVG